MSIYFVKEGVLEGYCYRSSTKVLLWVEVIRVEVIRVDGEIKEATKEDGVVTSKGVGVEIKVVGEIKEATKVVGEAIKGEIKAVGVIRVVIKVVGEAIKAAGVTKEETKEVGVIRVVISKEVGATRVPIKVDGATRVVTKADGVIKVEEVVTSGQTRAADGTMDGDQSIVIKITYLLS